jgi:hypothetical protein
MDKVFIACIWLAVLESGVELQRCALLAGDCHHRCAWYRPLHPLLIGIDYHRVQHRCPLNHGIPDGFSYVAIDWFLDRCIIVMNVNIQQWYAAWCHLLCPVTDDEDEVVDGIALYTKKPPSDYEESSDDVVALKWISSRGLSCLYIMSMEA